MEIAKGNIHRRINRVIAEHDRPESNTCCETSYVNEVNMNEVNVNKVNVSEVNEVNEMNLNDVSEMNLNDVSEVNEVNVNEMNLDEENYVDEIESVDCSSDEGITIVREHTNNDENILIGYLLTVFYIFMIVGDNLPAFIVLQPLSYIVLKKTPNIWILFMIVQIITVQIKLFIDGH